MWKFKLCDSVFVLLCFCIFVCLHLKEWCNRVPVDTHWHLDFSDSLQLPLSVSGVMLSHLRALRACSYSYFFFSPFPPLYKICQEVNKLHIYPIHSINILVTLKSIIAISTKNFCMRSTNRQNHNFVQKSCSRTWFQLDALPLLLQTALEKKPKLTNVRHPPGSKHTSPHLSCH